MRVFVAFGALGWCIPELHVHQGELHIWRMVAVSTSHSAMRACQGKIRFPMIEFRQVLPLFRGVTRQAPHGIAGGIVGVHARGELAFVHILMTSRTT